MMESKTLRDMIAAVYGGLYAEDCAMVDREWARMRGYILPTDGRSALRPAPVQAGAMHSEQQRIAAELNARQAGADAAEFDIEQARRDLIKDQQDLIYVQQKRINDIQASLDAARKALFEPNEANSYARRADGATSFDPEAQFDADVDRIVATAKPSAELPSAKTLLTYASILERLTDQAGFATGEIIEAACTALRHCAAIRSTSSPQAGADVKCSWCGAALAASPDPAHDTA